MGSAEAWWSSRIGVVAHLTPKVAFAASYFLHPAGVNRHRGEAVSAVVLADLRLQSALRGGDGLDAIEKT